MSIRPMDEQKCPLDIQMSIRPLDEQKCPLDIQMSIRPLDEWTNGHCLMASTLVSYPHGVRRMLNTSVSYKPQGVMLDRITYSIGTVTEMSIGKQKCPLDIHMSIGRTEMSIGHSYVHSSIGRTEMSIGHPNVHSSIGRMDEWTLSNGKHSSLLSTWGQT